MQTLGQYISNHPIRATQREWARFLGVSQPYLSQILSGTRTPHWRVMRRIEERTRGAVPMAVWFQGLDERSADTAQEAVAS
ncbi:helix-turn-helix domain-containing protein [Roseovarius nitratireducens]|uniref:helix-turn-helix domain-containing protein n=1 Tax=Roseovarius nitratireducens TaxID=2044597 RepID=UPI000CE1A43B|nr:helix-turn-helix transcriptional regulator [Roseovarius nitratireducens]